MLKVSVVVPALNCADYIEEAIESLLAQTMAPDEIIVVDNGSTDATLDRIKHFASKLIVSHEPKRGASAARNTGVKLACNELIAFLDSDDISTPTRLEKQVKTLERDNDAAMVFCDVEYCDEAGKPTGQVITYPGYRRDAFLGQLFERNRIPSTSAAMVRRSAFELAGGFDENYSFNEEYDLWLRIAAKNPVAYLPEPLVTYRIHCENISHQADEQRENEKKALLRHNTAEIRSALHSLYGNGAKADLALSTILFKMERFQEGERLLEDICADNDDLALRNFYLGNFALKRGDIIGAGQHYERSLEISPDLEVAQNNLGAILLFMQDWNGARKCFEKALSLKAGYQDPRHNILILKSKSTRKPRFTFTTLRPVLKPHHSE
ncbi:MAG: hypothetical protein CSA23_03440 [Deltaproteobacteria bacterium]|nr:MAG: hypothetical protein CSA23_03440 [Deltaproteobacteria bacterium]